MRGLERCEPCASVSPANTDPHTGYNTDGFPASYWWDGCHAWLFRPNVDW
jgi:hypothetical protein